MTFSTTSVAGRTLSKPLSDEGKAIQEAIFKPRLSTFYSKFDQKKLDDIPSILSLYVRRERNLLRGLQCKYGDGVPGDENFLSELVLITAAEAIGGGLTRSENDEDAEDQIFIDVRTQEEREDTGMWPTTFSLAFDEKDEKVIKAIKKSVSRKSPKSKICLLSSGNSRLFSLVDPARSASERANEYSRMLRAARMLAEAGLNSICAIRGGFAECYREAKMLDCEGCITEGSKGLMFRTCQAYASLNLKDTESLGYYIIGYFSEFKAPIVAPQNGLVRRESANASITKAPSQESIQQNLQAAFSNFGSLSAANLFKPGAASRSSSETKKQPNPASQPVILSSNGSNGSSNTDLFTIEDD